MQVSTRQACRQCGGLMNRGYRTPVCSRCRARSDDPRLLRPAWWEAWLDQTVRASDKETTAAHTAYCGLSSCIALVCARPIISQSRRPHRCQDISSLSPRSMQPSIPTTP